MLCKLEYYQASLYKMIPMIACSAFLKLLYWVILGWGCFNSLLEDSEISLLETADPKHLKAILT